MLPQSEKEKAAAEIMNMFAYYYRDAWAPDNIFAGKSRVWVQAFNELMEKGLIVRKKEAPGYKYKWAAEFPEGF
ncbi:MAG: hypothetical protein V1702_06430 [Candidatus Woesearchaeota archaeon]